MAEVSQDALATVQYLWPKFSEQMTVEGTVNMAQHALPLHPGDAYGARQLLAAWRLSSLTFRQVL